jgi:hypothetical protein
VAQQLTEEEQKKLLRQLLFDEDSDSEDDTPALDFDLVSLDDDTFDLLEQLGSTIHNLSQVMLATARWAGWASWDSTGEHGFHKLCFNLLSSRDLLALETNHTNNDDSGVAEDWRFQDWEFLQEDLHENDL